jgi:hypothetical protein
MKGEVVFLYAFDVANEIVTRKVQEILFQKPFPFEIHLDRTSPKEVPLYKPLAIEPMPLGERLTGQPVSLLIRVYELGVVSVTMRVPFAVSDLQELVGFHNPVLENGKSLDAVARDLCTEVCANLREYLVEGSPLPEPEAYTIFCLKEIDEVDDVHRWLAGQGRAVAGLLSETHPARLSEDQVAEVLRLRRSFEKTDLIVIDWDAALVVDLSRHVEDVLYVLELANLQLEVFRMMDQRLDHYLDRAYVDLERRQAGLFGRSAAALRVLRRFRVDVTKLTDEITNMSKFFGDWYLARVYLVARKRFHIDEWHRSVERRLAQLDQLYSVVHSEIYERRMLWLEVIIVILFVIDVVAILFFHKS